jgi:hypothetical protein
MLSIGQYFAGLYRINQIFKARIRTVPTAYMPHSGFLKSANKIGSISIQRWQIPSLNARENELRSDFVQTLGQFCPLASKREHE